GRNVRLTPLFLHLHLHLFFDADPVDFLDEDEDGDEDSFSILTRPRANTYRLKALRVHLTL
ncbi:MAG: hypothetical protein V3S78_06835, partial [Hyphomicrobium sp.]